MRAPSIVGERDPIMRAGRLAFTALAVGAMVGLLVAGVWFLTRPPMYSSTVVLELSPAAPVVDLAPTGPTVDELTVDTDAGLATSDLVAARVAEALGEPASAAGDPVSVRARQLSRVLEITYTTAEPGERAREGAAASAEVFLELRDQLVIQPVRDYLTTIAAGTIEFQDENEGQVQADEQGDVTVSRGQAALENRLQRALREQVALPGPGTVIAAASAPEARRGTVDVVLMSGAGLGAIIGFGVGLVWEARRRREATPGAEVGERLPALVDA